MPYINDETVQIIKSQNDIVDLIGSYVALQRKGSLYFGHCPFHNEKTPSFSVSPNRQSYFCYGCGRGGDVINFIQEQNNYTFCEAVGFLAKISGLEYLLEEESQQKKPKQIFLKKEEKKLLGIATRNRSYIVKECSTVPFPKKKRAIKKGKEYLAYEKVENPSNIMFPDLSSQKEFLVNRCKDYLKDVEQKIEEQEMITMQMEKLNEIVLSYMVLEELKEKKKQLELLQQKIIRT